MVYVPPAVPIDAACGAMRRSCAHCVFHALFRPPPRNLFFPLHRGIAGVLVMGFRLDVTKLWGRKKGPIRSSRWNGHMGLPYLGSAGAGLRDIGFCQGAIHSGQPGFSSGCSTPSQLGASMPGVTKPGPRGAQAPRNTSRMTIRPVIGRIRDVTLTSSTQHRILDLRRLDGKPVERTPVISGARNTGRGGCR